ncbi:MAG: succinate dehydrogenase assembly factor 2, partial [Pseudomonadota bacterium]
MQDKTSKAYMMNNDKTIEPDIVIMRKRILFRAHHRGMRELDLMLGRFADSHTHSMSWFELQCFMHILEIPEPVLHRFLMQKKDKQKKQLLIKNLLDELNFDSTHLPIKSKQIYRGMSDLLSKMIDTPFV